MNGYNKGMGVENVWAEFVASLFVYIIIYVCSETIELIWFTQLTCKAYWLGNVCITMKHIGWVFYVCLILLFGADSVSWCN